MQDSDRQLPLPLELCLSSKTCIVRKQLRKLIFIREQLILTTLLLGIETTTGARDIRGKNSPVFLVLFLFFFYGRLSADPALPGEETNVMVWGYVEAGVGVIAACLPTLRPLMNSRMPESIINSARSKLSLNSLKSSPPRQRRPSDTEELASHEQGFDISYGGIEDMDPRGCNITAHAEGLNGLDEAVKVPDDNQIRMERDFQVGEDRIQIISRE